MPVHFRFADALRTLAIVLVVMSHIVMVVPILKPLTPYRLAMGSWGVDGFFVLSGFLLCRPYIDALLGRIPLPDWRKFAKRRFLRIWPAYAAVVLFAFAKSALHNGINTNVVADTLTHLLMIHNFFTAFVAGADNISLWTMADDAQFYVALPCLAGLLYRRTTSYKSRDIAFVLASIVFLSIVWRIAIPLFTPSSMESILTVQRNLLGMGTSFAAGACLAYLGARGIRCPSFLALPLTALAIVLTTADFAVAAIIPDGALFKDFALDSLGTIAIALTIFAIPHVAWRPLDIALDSKLVATAASNAYCLYLLHVPIKQTVDSFLTGHGVIGDSARYGILFPTCFVACCAVSVPLLHYLIEQPFLTLKERARETNVASTA